MQQNEHEKSRLLYEKNKRLNSVGTIYNMQFSDSLDRGAYDFKQKIIHAAGVPIFPQQGITQMIQTLDHDTVFSRGKDYLEFLLSHSAVLLSVFIVSS